MSANEIIRKAVGKLWGLLTSVRTALTVFAVILLTSVIGTLIPQDEDKAMGFLSSLTKGDASGFYDVFLKLGFIDMYHSWWYMSMLLVLALNILACSIDRLPGVLKIIKAPVRPLSSARIQKMAVNRSVLLKGRPEDIKGPLLAALKRAGFKMTDFKMAGSNMENTAADGDEAGYRLCAHRGRWSRLGVYVTHLSIVAILFGVLAGLLFSQESYISLPEGDVSSVTYPLPGSGETRPIPLGFQIRADDFQVEFYGGTEIAKAYKSRVTVIEDGKEVLSKTVMVNDPLKYRGTTFYLSDYGVVPRRLTQGTFIFNVTSRDGQSTAVRVRPGEGLRIPNSSITGRVLDFSPTLSHGERGGLQSETEKLDNPAVKLEFSDSGTHLFSGWLLKRFPGKTLLPDGTKVDLLDYWGVEYTFFRIRKDPGGRLVKTGLITMGIGLFIALFMSHRKIWVNLDIVGQGTRALVGATSNKNRAALEKRVNRVMAALLRGA